MLSKSHALGSAVTRRTIVAAAIACGVTSVAPALAEIKGLEIIAPAGPGGGYDQLARATQEMLQKGGLASGVQVQNIPGAGGTIGLVGRLPRGLRPTGTLYVVAAHAVEGAKLLRDGAKAAGVEIQPIYRVHPSPEPDKVRRFEKLLAAMVRVHRLDPTVFGWRAAGTVALNDFLDGLPTTGPHARLSQAIHRGIAGSHLHLFPDGKHNIHQRFAGDFNAMVFAFLTRPD